MNTKAKGSKNERRSIRILEASGYLCTKSGASLGVFDVIGIGPTDIVLLQCKTNEWPGTVEMEALRMFRAPGICKKLVHRWRDGCEIPDVREI